MIRRSSDGLGRVAFAACLAVSLLCSAHLASAQDTPPELTPLLLALRTDDPDLQREVLDQIVALGEAAVAALEALAADATGDVRQRGGAIFALGRIGSERSQAVLQALWDSGLEALGGGLAIQVATALGDFGASGPLIAMVEAGDEVLGAKAAIQLGLHRAAEGREALAIAWDDPRYERLRVFFAIALGLVGDDRGAELLRSAIRSRELANHCAIALGTLGEAARYPFEVEFAFSDPDPLVRRIALAVAIEAELPRLDELLEAAASDRDAAVRELAREASEARERRNRRRR